MIFAVWNISKSEFKNVYSNFYGITINFECIPILISAWSIKFKDLSSKRKGVKSAFPEPEFEESVDQSRPDVEEFKFECFEKLNWHTFGSMIAKLYDYLSNIDNGAALSTVFESGDFLLEDIQPEPVQTEVNDETPANLDEESELKPQNESETDIQMEDKQENSNSNGAKCTTVLNPEGANSIDGSTEDSDAPTTGDDAKPAAKPKSRRRGSDLKLLDPWFYWKNRKYSQRQKNRQMERVETDTTINGLLRKILEKYYELVPSLLQQFQNSNSGMNNE